MYNTQYVWEKHLQCCAKDTHRFFKRRTAPPLAIAAPSTPMLLLKHPPVARAASTRSAAALQPPKHHHPPVWTTPRAVVTPPEQPRAPLMNRHVKPARLLLHATAAAPVVGVPSGAKGLQYRGHQAPRPSSSSPGHRLFGPDASPPHPATPMHPLWNAVVRK